MLEGCGADLPYNMSKGAIIIYTLNSNNNTHTQTHKHTGKIPHSKPTNPRKWLELNGGSPMSHDVPPRSIASGRSWALHLPWTT